MKKLTLLCGIGAMMMASCSNDDLVIKPQVDEMADTAIGFSVSTGNMTRADTPLSDEHWDFGVWAYKGTDEPGTLVMENYLVGYWDRIKDLGYKALDDSQLLEGSNNSSYVWYYEGLGNLQNDTWTDEAGVSQGATFQFNAGTSGKSAATAYKDIQYLKYWDKAENMNTWFFAYAPYGLTDDDENVVKFNPSTYTITFPKIDTSNAADVMYAVKKVNNTTVTTIINSTVTTDNYVNLSFDRLLAQIRVAFYEEVPGYSVELIPYSTEVSIPESDPWKEFGINAMYAVPATRTGDAVSGYTYDEGSYVTSAKPEITFGGADYLTPSVSYSDESTSNANLNIPLYFYTIGHKDTANKLVLGTTKETAIVNDAKDVLPQASDSDCGFTLNLSLKFKATDTQEEIIVKGVRVHVPATDCRWLPNHLYTYYFKITKNVPGSPDDPDDLDDDPGNDDPYLMPIVFDNVTVQAITEETDPGYEYEIE